MFGLKKQYSAAEYKTVDKLRKAAGTHDWVAYAQEKSKIRKMTQFIERWIGVIETDPRFGRDMDDPELKLELQRMRERADAKISAQYERERMADARAGRHYKHITIMPGGEEAYMLDYEDMCAKMGIRLPDLQHKPQKRAAAPNLPPALTAPPELTADVLGTGLTPTAAPKARKPAARKPKTKVAATPKPKPKATKPKATKPKAKKTATTPKLTAAQREYLAVYGFVKVKRGGKFIKITK